MSAASRRVCRQPGRIVAGRRLPQKLWTAAQKHGRPVEGDQPATSVGPADGGYQPVLCLRRNRWREARSALLLYASARPPYAKIRKYSEKPFRRRSFLKGYVCGQVRGRCAQAISVFISPSYVGVVWFEVRASRAILLLAFGGSELLSLLSVILIEARRLWEGLVEVQLWRCLGALKAKRAGNSVVQHHLHLG